jgi:zinc D-Ala-D-Ala carboxypeptidase
MPLLTTHFSLQELTVTQQVGPDGRLLYNLPGDVEVLYLRILAETLLEPIRELWDCPVRITSGYRSPAVELVVSKKLYGQHMKGQAADIHPLGDLDLDEAYRRIWASALPYDQLLLEGTGDRRWIHVSCSQVYYPPRREALVSPDGNHWAVYSPPAAQEGNA